jgi:hypothetical protein
MADRRGEKPQNHSSFRLKRTATSERSYIAKDISSACWDIGRYRIGLIHAGLGLLNQSAAIDGLAVEVDAHDPLRRRDVL